MSAVRVSRNLAASIRQRLLDRARARGEDFQLLLDRYAVERLLYRLSISDERDEFLLKGALLFALWFHDAHRPTRDADFLGYGPRDARALVETVRRICAIECEDGIAYDPDSIKVVEIREHATYQGLRVTLRAELDKARCIVQLDVGYGDAVTPGPVDIKYPGLLDDLPASTLARIPARNGVRRKTEAIAQLGIANSRMKDYFDLWALAREGAMDLHELGQAIAATFARRGTPLPAPMPAGLTAAFSDDTQKQKQWNGFVARNRLDAPTLDAVVEALATFVEEPLTHARQTKPGAETREQFRSSCEPSFPSQYDAAIKAEAAVHSDPRTACFYARRALELAVNWALQARPGAQTAVPGQPSALIHEPTFKQTAGDAVFSKARVIVTLGNHAVHSHRPIPDNDALVAVRELFHICYWLARTYGRVGRPAPGLAFDPGALPKPTADSAADRRAARSAWRLACASGTRS